MEQSMILAEYGEEGDGIRYRMLEPIRQYAREKLEEGGDAEEIRRRHASFFLALAEKAEPKLRGPEAMEWLERDGLQNQQVDGALNEIGWLAHGCAPLVYLQERI